MRPLSTIHVCNRRNKSPPPKTFLWRPRQRKTPRFAASRRRRPEPRPECLCHTPSQAGSQAAARLGKRRSPRSSVPAGPQSLVRPPVQRPEQARAGGASREGIPRPTQVSRRRRPVRRGRGRRGLRGGAAPPRGRAGRGGGLSAGVQADRSGGSARPWGSPAARGGARAGPGQWARRAGPGGPSASRPRRGRRRESGAGGV